MNSRHISTIENSNCCVAQKSFGKGDCKTRIYICRRTKYKHVCRRTIVGKVFCFLAYFFLLLFFAIVFRCCWFLLSFLYLTSSYLLHTYFINRVCSSLFCDLRFHLHHSSYRQSAKFINNMRLLLTIFFKSMHISIPSYLFSFQHLDIWRFHSILFALALLITFMCSFVSFSLPTTTTKEPKS